MKNISKLILGSMLTILTACGGESVIPNTSLAEISQNNENTSQQNNNSSTNNNNQSSNGSGNNNQQSQGSNSSNPNNNGNSGNNNGNSSNNNDPSNNPGNNNSNNNQQNLIPENRETLLKGENLNQVTFQATDIFSGSEHGQFLKFEKDVNGEYNIVKLTTGDGVTHTGEKNNDGSYHFIEQYGYEYENTPMGDIEVYFEEGKVPTLEEVKNKLNEYVDTNAESRNCGNECKNNVKVLIDELQESDLTGNGKLELDGFPALNLIPEWYGKEINLSYSDFGDFKVEGDNDYLLLAGGDNDKNISKDILRNINDKIVFEGKSVAEVSYEDEDNYDAMLIKGDVNLTLEDGKSTLNATYDNWYDIEVVDDISDVNGIHTMEFKNGDRITNEEFKFNGGNNFSVDRTGSEITDFGVYKRDHNNVEYAVTSKIEYYGDNNNPIEAIGQIGYGEQDGNYDKRFEMVFGVKKK